MRLVQRRRRHSADHAVTAVDADDLTGDPGRLRAGEKRDQGRDVFRLPDPARPGETLSLWQVTSGLAQRLIGLFARDADGRRPAHGRHEKFRTDPHWRDLVLFYEYFDGDSGAGLGASHQTGWSALVAKLIQQHAEYTLQGRVHDVAFPPPPPSTPAPARARSRASAPARSRAVAPARKRS